MSNDVFYVYIYLDPRKPGKHTYGNLRFDYEPFYVGKGRGNRYRHHLIYPEEWKSNSHKGRKIKKILSLGVEPIIVFLAQNISDVEAKRIEIDTIATIGRRPGPLTNLTDGGDGSVGYIASQSARNKISKSRIGRKPWNHGLNAGTDKRVQANHATRYETMKRLDLWKRRDKSGIKRRKDSPIYGRRYGKKHKKKISDSKMGMLNPQAKLMVIMTPDGMRALSNATDFIRQHGRRYKISKYFLYKRAKQSAPRGRWRVRYV